MNENVDPSELQKFTNLCHKWWDKNGEFRTLHELNPLRLEYINRHLSLKGKKILDVGCGGGILSESMCEKGASVLGVDLAKKSLKIAKLHGFDSGISVTYRCVSVEQLAGEKPEKFDVITCMEMLEHVPNPQSIVDSIGNLLKPSGWVFFSTINRNLKSYMTTIIAAEYILGLLPRQTHNYQRFIKPHELAAMARKSGMSLIDMRGINYQPFKHQVSLSHDNYTNYIMAFRLR